MWILAIETTWERGSVALAFCDANSSPLGSALHFKLEWLPEVGNAEELPTRIQQILELASIRVQDLSEVVVDAGPGSYTGIRVGIAFALGLSAAISAPVIRYSALHAMVHHEDVDDSLPIRIPVLNARRGELYLAVYSAAGDILEEPQLGTPLLVDELQRRYPNSSVLGADALSTPPGKSTLGEQEEARLLREWTEQLAARMDGIRPTAWGLLKTHLNLKGTSSLDDVLYIRDADAIKPKVPCNPLSRPRI